MAAIVAAEGEPSGLAAKSATVGRPSLKLGTNAAAAIMALLLGWLFGRFGERNQRAGRTS